MFKNLFREPTLIEQLEAVRYNKTCIDCNTKEALKTTRRFQCLTWLKCTNCGSEFEVAILVGELVDAIRCN